MFHKAIGLAYGEGTTLELTFQDGKVKRYDMSALFGKYPQLEALTVREEKPAAFTMVGNAVAAARAKKGLSQKELSDLTGIDQSDLSRIERGIANPSVNTLNRIAEALDAKLQISIA